MRLSGIKPAEVAAPAAKASSAATTPARPAAWPTKSAANGSCPADKQPSASAAKQATTTGEIAPVLRLIGLQGIAQSVHINTRKRAHLARLSRDCHRFAAEVAIGGNRRQLRAGSASLPARSLCIRAQRAGQAHILSARSSQLLYRLGNGTLCHSG